MQNENREYTVIWTLKPNTRPQKRRYCPVQSFTLAFTNFGQQRNVFQRHSRNLSFIFTSLQRCLRYCYTNSNFGASLIRKHKQHYLDLFFVIRVTLAAQSYAIHKIVFFHCWPRWEQKIWKHDNLSPSNIFGENRGHLGCSRLFWGRKVRSLTFRKKSEQEHFLHIFL